MYFRKFIRIVLVPALMIAAVTCRAQSAKIDSLKQVLKHLAMDTNRVKTLNLLASQYISISPDTLLVYAAKADELSKKLEWKKGEGNAEHTLGIYYYLESKYDTALLHWQNALGIRQAIGDQNSSATTLGNIGLLYWKQNNYPMAFEYYFKALALAEKIGNQDAKALQLGNLAILYQEQNDFSNALTYYLKAEEMYEKLGMKYDVASNLCNIGVMYKKQGNLDRALDYYGRSLKAAEDLNYAELESDVLGDFGLVYQLRKNYRKAMMYFFRALSFSKQVNDQTGIASQYSNIAESCLFLLKKDSAQQYIDSALTLARKIRYKEAIRASYQNLCVLDSLRGDDESHLTDYKMYIVYRDSMSNDDNTKRQTQIEMQYAFDKKTASDSVRNAEAAARELIEHQNEIHQQQLYTWAGAAGFVLMLVVAVVSIRAFRNKKKANEIISHQKALVEEKQKEILDSIHYAKRIQRSLLPSEQYIRKNLNKGGDRANN